MIVTFTATRLAYAGTMLGSSHRTGAAGWTEAGLNGAGLLPGRQAPPGGYCNGDGSVSRAYRG